MKNIKIIRWLLPMFIMLGLNIQAHAADLAVGAKVSTLGFGVEAVTNVVPMLVNVRLQGNYFNYDTTVTDTNVTYDGQLKLGSVGLLADIYPLATKLRITGGLYYNGNKLDMNAQQAGFVVIGGNAYLNPNITTTVDFNQVAPYVGIGWGDAISSGSPIGFNIELGALYQGTPNTSIVAPGVAPADIAVEKQRLDDALNWFTWYPVIAVGVNWRF